MHKFILMALSLLWTGCASAPRSIPMSLGAQPDVRVVATGHTLTYTAPPGWIVADIKPSNEIGFVAEVSLARPELDGRMHLAVIDAQDMSPRVQAQLEHADLLTLIPDVLLSEVQDGLNGNTNEASFVARWLHDAAPDEVVRRAKLIIRTIPGDSEHLAYCMGWWPEDSHEFLLAPLHQACNSVRSSK